MYFKKLVEVIEECKSEMNPRVYRTMLAKSLVMYFAQHYSIKSEIQYQVNLKLFEKGLEHISYMFVTDTLKEE